MKFFAWLEKKRATYFLIIASFIFFLFRLPSLFEPYWYGDEGIYEVIGNSLRHGRLLYSGIWDNKPPLLYYMYAIFSGNQEPVRLFSLIVGVLSLITFFFVAKKLFKEEKAQFIATGMFGLLFATPLTEGNIANAENFMLLPILLAALLLLKSMLQTEHTSLKYKHFFLPGLLIGIAFLLKIVAVFDFAAFFVFLFIITYKDLGSIKKQLPILLSFLGGFIMPIIWICLWFLLRGSFVDFITSTFFSNVGYVNYGNKFIIPQGLLVIKLFFLGLFVLFVFFKRHRFSKQSIFILLWLAFSIFNALFSQRPYMHYFLVAISSLSLCVGLIICEKKFFRPFIAALCIALLLLLPQFKILNGFSKFSFGYYGNFLQFVAQQKSVKEYQSFFDRATTRDYTLAEYITVHKKASDSLFIWGNSGQIYQLTHLLPPGRYIVAYHMVSSTKTINETAQILKRIKPTFIIILPKMSYPPYGLNDYHIVFSINDAYIYEKVF